MKKKRRHHDYILPVEQFENQSNFGKKEVHHPDALSPDEILRDKNEEYQENTALQSLIKKMTVNEEPKPESTEEPPVPQEAKEETTSEAIKTEPAAKSLLDKCMPYIIDDEGNDASVNKEPLYKLESVAEILKADSKRTLEKLSREYGITFDEEPVSPAVTVNEEPEPQPIEEEIEEIPEAEEDKIQVISDIDIPDSPFYEIDSKEPAIEETVTFTPITDKAEKKSKIIISTHTKPLDFTGELLKIKEKPVKEAAEVQLEKSEFDEYKPAVEFCDNESGKKIIKAFAKEKKLSFLAMWGSILLTLLASAFKLPFMSDAILTHTRACMIITSALALLAVLANIKIFAGFGKLFTNKAGSDILVALAVLGVAAYSVTGIIAGEIIINTQLLLMIILSSHGVNRFMRASQALTSFKQIYNNSPKHTISLLSDPAITMAMTKGAVEGDCLVAAAQGTVKIEDFMKFSTFGKFLNGKVGIITAASVLLSIATCILATSFYSELVYGFYAVSAIQCLAALPTLLFIDALPLYHSSKKLARTGAMIAGKAGAEAVEQANAVVVNAKDLFPSGSITMHRMQVLSENNLEDTIIRAASLTEAMQSPLAPIFKRIAGTGNITAFPDSDTVKYEEAMGISGWVDNRLLFIGNRTLMEAHGIAVPDVEVDRKILRQGFFPVYVSDQNKACALIIIRYDVNPDIARELKKLTIGGVTLLVKSSDPNLTEEMICDYFGLYDDSVKVMTAAGCHIYVNSVTDVKSASAPAAFKTNFLSLPSILNCAFRIKRSNIILITAYILSSVLGVLLFAYTSFGGSGSLLSDTALLLYGMLSTALSYLIYLTQKP